MIAPPPAVISPAPAHWPSPRPRRTELTLRLEQLRQQLDRADEERAALLAASAALRSR